MLRAGEVTGYVFERQQRNIKSIAKSHETRTFHRSIDIEDPSEVSRLIADDADGATIEACETHDQILRVVFMDFEEIAVVHNGMKRIFDVVRLLWVWRNEGVERFVAARRRIGSGSSRRILEIV